MIALWDIVEGRCSCGNTGCKAVGKHPKPYEKADLTKGYGVPCGNGLVVLDIDVKTCNGFDSLEGKDLPDTKTVRTPTGGAHLYYRYDPAIHAIGNRVGIFPGVDIRGEGGFVVGAGSPHANGGIYQEIGACAVNPAPQWLLEMAKKSSGGEPRVRAIVDIPNADSRSAAAQVLGDAWPTSGRHVAQLALAGALVAAGWPEDAIVAFLVVVCTVAGDADPTKRQATVRNTIETYEEGGNVYGWTELANHVDTEICKKARNILFPPPVGSKFQDAVDEIINEEARKRQNERVYTFVPGEFKPLPELISIGHTKLINILKKSRHWEGVWAYDEFRRRTVARNPPLRLDAEEGQEGLQESDYQAIRSWLECHALAVTPKEKELPQAYDGVIWPMIWEEPRCSGEGKNLVGVKANKDAVVAAIDVVVKQNRVHPVKEYLNGLPPPTTHYLDDLATLAYGAESKLENEFFKMTLVGAVRRIFHPGTKMDTMLVLYGKQGEPKKSTSLEALFGKGFFKDDMPDLSNQRDAASSTEGFWCIEFAELKQILREDDKVIKSFLSRTVDVYTPKYERSQLSVPRQCVFFGTTNEDDIIRDPSGGRRYWPVCCLKSGLAFMQEHRDEIWSEALALSKTDFKHWFEDEDAANKWRKQFTQDDAWTEDIIRLCGDKEYVSVPELWIALCGGTTITSATGERMTTKVGKSTRSDELRICNILKQNGRTRVLVRVDGVVKRVWIKH